LNVKLPAVMCDGDELDGAEGRPTVGAALISPTAPRPETRTAGRSCASPRRAPSCWPWRSCLASSSPGRCADAGARAIVRRNNDRAPPSGPESGARVTVRSSVGGRWGPNDEPSGYRVVTVGSVPRETAPCQDQARIWRMHLSARTWVDSPPNGAAVHDRSFQAMACAPGVIVVACLIARAAT